MTNQISDEALQDKIMQDTSIKKYNHAYTIAFSVQSDQHPNAPCVPQEIIAALLLRLHELIENPEMIDECLGAPFDSFRNDDQPID